MMGESCCSKGDAPCKNNTPENFAEPENCCSLNAETDAQLDSSARCLAVVKENGTGVVVFDASGKPRTFQYQGDKQNLCFKTHGNESAGDLLTPCFDEEGNHGDPEEDCFCGVDTPHLHAHPYDPKACHDDDNFAGDKIALLASQILHPVATADDEENLINIGISESMPNECNARVLQEKRLLRDKMHTRRLHKVQHEDHVDYLVHNNKTGELLLEHPCDDCGQDDIHGSFHNVGERRLKQSAGSAILLHFFQVSSKPFTLLDIVHSAFDVNSDRVAAATLDHKSREIHRQRVSSTAVTARDFKTGDVVSSTLLCSGICCASECPIVERILSDLSGVEKIMINVPLRQVIVKHDPHTISAKELEQALNNEKLGASIVRDGAATNGISKQTTAPSNSNVVGRSQFFVQHICCASEIPAIRKIVEQLKGVSSVSINTTTKSVYVDHEVSVVSAQDICDSLNREHFGAEIRYDAASSAVSASKTFVQSTLSLDDPADDPDTERLTALLIGEFDSSQIQSLSVDVANRRITVWHNPFLVNAGTLATFLKERAGLHISVSIDGADPSCWSLPGIIENEASDEASADKEIPTYPKVTVVLSGVFWIISMLHYVGGNWEYLSYVGLLSVTTGLPTIAMKALRTMRRLQFDTNCLMFLASIGAVALQDYAEAAAVVFLFSLSEWLEVRATSRARQALSAIVHLRPEKANLVHPSTHELICVSAASVPIGALVVVRTGDKVPCDGVITSGQSTVDESSLTGESKPIRKGPGDKVSGGTLNSGLSQLTVRTESTSENSAVARLIRLVEEAQANRSDTEKLVDEFARWYTPVILLGAVLMCSVPWLFGSDTGKEWTASGLILIVVACPCALVISTPVAYVAGLAATAQRGILIKGGAILEALASVENICFDKTGTLTNGEFALLHLKLVPEKLSRAEVLGYLSAMEERASHPVAQAIVNAARSEKAFIRTDFKIENHVIVAGAGVEGLVNGKRVRIGNDRLFKGLGLLEDLSPSICAEVESWKGLGGTIGYMSIEGYGIVCAFCAADAVRTESAEVVRKLTDAGIKITMLTGDNDDTAHAIGGQIGLSPSQVKSKLLPEEKLQFIQGLSEEHAPKSILLNLFGKKHVSLMCGDGVNDAPSLATANIGVAMGHGAALAMETADVTLLDSNLEKLLYSIETGKRVTRKIKENVVFSLVVKFVVLGFAVAGMTHLWVAIASDVGSMILVTLNAMTILPKRRIEGDVSGAKCDMEEGCVSSKVTINDTTK